MGETSLPGRKRRPHRRDEILAAAAGLFHERGYDATGIDDIAAVIGMTGPAVYRHFSSKQDILDTLVESRGTAVLAEVKALVAANEGREPAAVLEALVRHYAEAVAGNPSEVVVAVYERRTLGAGTRAAIERLERENFEVWAGLVGAVRTDLDDASVRTLVQGALSMGVAVANYQSGLSREATAALLASMVGAALGQRAVRRTRRPASTRRPTTRSSSRPGS